MKKRKINGFNRFRPLHLGNEDGNLDPRIVAHVQEASVDVQWVIFEEVHGESFSEDSFQLVVTSRWCFDDSTEIELEHNN